MQSEWCENWHKQIKKGDGYKKLRKMFIKHEWDVSIQNYFYNTFMKTNKKDPGSHANYKDYYLYWKERLEGINVGDEHLLYQFQSMLPPRAAAKLDIQETNTLERFDAFIFSLDDRELEWYDSKIVNTFEKRKEILQKKKEGKRSGTNTNTGNNKGKFNHIPVNQVSSTLENDEEENANQDF